MPFDFRSRRLYLYALFPHCGVAIIIFIVILPVAWLSTSLKIHKKYGHMPFDFLSWRHYLNALFRHCGVALIIFIVILPFAEPIRDWGPTFLSIVEAKISFLKTEFYLTYQNFTNDDLKHSACGWFHNCCH